MTQLSPCHGSYVWTRISSNSSSYLVHYIVCIVNFRTHVVCAYFRISNFVPIYAEKCARDGCRCKNDLRDIDNR